jgi:hypothetical protein
MNTYFKAIIIATVIFINTNSAYSQFKNELSVGFIQGVVYPTVSFEPLVTQQSFFRYHGGVAVRYIAEPNVGIQAELTYSQRGWNEQAYSSGYFRKEIDYIELPLLTHIYMGKDAFRFFVQLGPKIRYAINETNTNTYINSTSHQHTTEIDNQVDYSLLGGLGIEIRTKKIGYFQVEARYDFGIGDIYSNRKADYFARSSNQAIIASINYLYPLFKKK